MRFYKAIRAIFEHKKGFNINSLMGNLIVNVGCGNKPLDGFINTDYYNKKHADKIFDLGVEFPFDPESIDLIYADNVFEHLPNIIDVIDRCYEALKPGGRLVIMVPYFKSKHAFVDPTHVRFFTIQTLDYFVQGTYFNKQYKFNDRNFRRMSVFFDPDNCSLIRNIIAAYAIRRPNFFENSILSNIVVFHNIVFVLEK
jgi:SAM-dependent methyltransferase